MQFEQKSPNGILKKVETPTTRDKKNLRVHFDAVDDELKIDDRSNEVDSDPHHMLTPKRRTPYAHKLRSSKKDASNSVDESSHRLPPFWDFRLSPYSKKKPTGIQALSPTSKINFKIELKQPSTPNNKLNKQIGNSPRHHSLPATPVGLQSPSKLTNDSEKISNAVKPFMPEFIGSNYRIELLIPTLARSASRSHLNNQLIKKKVFTLGAFASLSDSEVAQLPIKSTRDKSKIQLAREEVTKFISDKIRAESFNISCAIQDCNRTSGSPLKTLPGTTVTMTTDPINECAAEKLTVHELQTNLLRSEKEFLNGVMNDTIPEQTSQTVNAKLNEGTTLTDDRNESSIITFGQLEPETALGQIITLADNMDERTFLPDQINESNEPFLNQENGAVKYVSTFNALPLHSQRVQDEQLDFVDVETLDNCPPKNEAIKNAQVIGVGHHHHDLQQQLTGPNGIQHHVIPGSDSGQTPINKEAIIIDERTHSHVQQTDNYDVVGINQPANVGTDSGYLHLNTLKQKVMALLSPTTNEDKLKLIETTNEIFHNFHASICKDLLNTHSFD